MKTNFLEILSQSAFHELCTTNACDVGSVDVECGPIIPGRRKRRQLDIHNSDPHREKRSSHFTHKLKVSFDLWVTIPYGEGPVDVDHLYTVTTNQLFDMHDQIEREVNNGDFDMQIDGLDIETDKSSLSYGWETLNCPDGMVEEFTTFTCS